ncbi:hypothetical protein BVX93_01530, partial [bacterium B13(2017)]
MVEVLDQILPLEDEEVVSVLVRNFKRKKINLLTSTKVLSYSKQEDQLEVEIENGKTITTEKILVSVGRIPNSEDLGLENMGIETENGFIKVSDYYQTNIENIFAIGDVINTPQLAHLASKEGEIAVEFMAGKNPPKKADFSQNPGAVSFSSTPLPLPPPPLVFFSFVSLSFSPPPTALLIMYPYLSDITHLTSRYKSIL